MAVPMPSEQLQLLIAGYILGDLDAAEAAELERWLATDPAIAAEVSRMQQALEVSHLPPESSPPPHLKSTILAALESERSATAYLNGRSRFRLQRRSLSWNHLLGAGAAALIVALGASNWQLHQTIQSLQASTPSDNQLIYRLSSTDASSAATAQVVVDPVRLEAALTVENLPPLPAGQIYALWTVLEPGAPYTTDPKNAILTDVFQPDDRGQVSQTLTVPAVYRSSQRVVKVAITVEDATAPQIHQGQPILMTGS